MSISEVVRNWLLEPVLLELRKVEKKMATELENAVETLKAKIAEVGTTLTDFSGDFQAAIDKLQADIAAGGVKPETVADLVALADTVNQITTGLKSLDSTAEGISGKPTP